MKFSGRSRNVAAMKCRAQTSGRRHESSILEIPSKITLISPIAGSGSKVQDLTLKSRQSKLLNQSNTATDSVRIHLLKSRVPSAGQMPQRGDLSLITLIWWERQERHFPDDSLLSVQQVSPKLDGPRCSHRGQRDIKPETHCCINLHFTFLPLFETFYVHSSVN